VTPANFIMLIILFRQHVAAAACSQMAAAAQAAVAAAWQGAVAVLSARVLRTVNDSHSSGKARAELLADFETRAALQCIWRCWLVVCDKLQVRQLLALVLAVLLRL
jgi:hypothetical protein